VIYYPLSVLMFAGSFSYQTAAFIESGGATPEHFACMGSLSA
jgi:hypothetical protein